jgi:hypothetical protein
VKYSDGDMLKFILDRQNEDGGWSLAGASDVDITAMTVQALAPYYYNNAEVHEAADRALSWLSDAQQFDGGFLSWGTSNAESAAQVMVALTMLGIDPAADERFIKDGNTVLDGILKFRMSDGGFTHTFDLDPENPFSVSGSFNDMATDQAGYALVAYWRFLNELRPLYDYSPEFTAETRGAVENTEQLIETAIISENEHDITAAVNAYNLLPARDRSYVRNYLGLAKFTKKEKRIIQVVGNTPGEMEITAEFIGDGSSLKLENCEICADECQGHSFDEGELSLIIEEITVYNPKGSDITIEVFFSNILESLKNRKNTG